MVSLYVNSYSQKTSTQSREKHKAKMKSMEGMHPMTMVELHALKTKLRGKEEELSQSQNELKRTREELLKCRGEVKQLEEVRLTAAQVCIIHVLCTVYVCIQVLLNVIYECHKYRPVCVCLQLVDVDLVEKVESLKRQLEEKSNREKEEEKHTISEQDVVSSDYT